MQVFSCEIVVPMCALNQFANVEVWAAETSIWDTVTSWWWHNRTLTSKGWGTFL